MNGDGDMDIKDVVERMGGSVRTLRGYIAEDKRKPAGERLIPTPRRLMGKDVWNETEYQRLKRAIEILSAKGSGSRTGTESSTYGERLESTDAQSALDEVLDFRPFLKTAKTPRRSATRSKAKSGRKRSTASGQVARFPSPHAPI